MSQRPHISRRSLAAASVTLPVIFAGTPTALPIVAAASAASGAFAGPPASMRFGPVKVTVVVRGKRIVSVTATAPTSHARSAVINNEAVPILRREVLQAQSPNVHSVSGATLTSRAFYNSLLGALHAAGLR